MDKWNMEVEVGVAGAGGCIGLAKVRLGGIP